MNKWEEVAKLFDVELEEEFYTVFSSGVKRTSIFSEKYGYLFRYKGREETKNSELFNLFYGNWKIVKKPWKPRKGETYWCLLNGGYIRNSWHDDRYDLTLWKSGNCFKTKEEAETKSKELMEQIRKEYENE